MFLRGYRGRVRLRLVGGYGFVHGDLSNVTQQGPIPRGRREVMVWRGKRRMLIHVYAYGGFAGGRSRTTGRHGVGHVSWDLEQGVAFYGIVVRKLGIGIGMRVDEHVLFSTTLTTKGSVFCFIVHVGRGSDIIGMMHCFLLFPVRAGR